MGLMDFFMNASANTAIFNLKLHVKRFNGSFPHNPKAASEVVLEMLEMAISALTAKRTKDELLNHLLPEAQSDDIKTLTELTLNMAEAYYLKNEKLKNPTFLTLQTFFEAKTGFRIP